MTQRPEPDLQDTADEITALVRSGQGLEAMRLLQERRATQPEDLRQALDRYVAADAGAALERDSASLRVQGHGRHSYVLERPPTRLRCQISRVSIG